MMFGWKIRPALVGAVALLSALSPAARAEGWGTITAQVVVDGDVPEREKIKVTKDQEACLAKGDLLSEDYVVNPKNKGVKNVIVWLIDATDAKKKLPIHPRLANVKLPPVEIDQPCCQFIPHVAAMREGQDLIFKNSAMIAHNVHLIAVGTKGPNMNFILPAGGQKKLDAEEVPAQRLPITVQCDIHPWMSARIGVFAHPYFAVTDADGKFTIKDAPAGDWRIVLWQESKGWVTGDKTGLAVTVADGKTMDLGQIKFTPTKKD
jgi:hypothetical protein